MTSAVSALSVASGRERSLPHVCFVAPHAFPILAGDENIDVVGGSELQQVIVARGLAQRGYPVSMICLDFGQEDRIEIDGVTVLRAFKPNEGIPVLRFLWPRLTSILSCLERADADIYYQRSATMLMGVVAWFCKRNRKRSIFAVASNSDLIRDQTMIRYARDRWIYEYGVRHAERILVQNRDQARLCMERFGRDSTVVPNAWPVPDFQAAESSRNEVLWVSTIRQIKRPELFLDVAEALPRYRFRMIGGSASDEPQLFEKIRARAAELSNVAFEGFVPYRRIHDYFDKAALFLNTSNFEGFPNTFLQAWVRGIPTVSFIDCGARLDGTVVGRIVSSLDEMISAVSDLMSHEDQRSETALACRRYVSANHSMDRVLDLYEEVFRELRDGAPLPQ